MKVQNVGDCFLWMIISQCVQSHPLSISWLINHFLPNLEWRCVIMRRCVMQKNWFTIFNVKITVRASIIKMWLFFSIDIFGDKLKLVFSPDVILCGLLGSKHQLSKFETTGLFATKLGLIVQHHKLECSVEKWVTAFKVKVTVKDNRMKIYL